MNKAESILDFKADKGTIQKGAISSLLYHLLFKLKGFVTIPIITYYLAPKDMGIYNLIIVTASLLMPLFYMNLGDGPVVYFVREKSKATIQDMYNTVVNSSLLFFTLYSIIFIIIIINFFGDKQYLYYSIPVIFSMILFKLSSNIYVIFLKTTTAVKSKFFVEMIGAVLTILLLVIGFSWDGMIYAVIASNIVVGIYIYQLAKHEFPLRIFIQKKILTNFLKISIPLLPVFFFSWVILSSDSYFLLHYKGENFVGKYAVIYGLSSVILILRMTLNFFWFPLSSKLWIENRENYKRVFGMIFTTLSIGLLMAVLIFELNSKVFMQIFARSIEYRDSYVIMGTIALAFGMMVLITLLTGPLYSNKNTTSISVSYLAGAILNCALNFLLVPPYGIWGAAISTVVSYLLIILMMAYLNYNIAKFSFFDKRLIYVLISFVPVWFVISVIREKVDILQLLMVNVGMVSILGALIYFKVLRKEEKEYFTSIFNEFRLKKNIKHNQ